MAEDSTHDDSSSTTDSTDDFDLSAEDNVGNTSDDSPDDQQTDDSDTASAEGDDNLTSDDDATDDKEPDAKSDKTPAFDADLEEWAEKTGRDKPENDRERKLLQDIRNGQRDFTRSRQSKKTAEDLQKTIKDATPDSKTDDDDTGDPLEKDVKALRNDLKQERTTRLQSEFFSEKGVTEEEVAVMGEILKEKADKGGQKALDYWTDPDNLSDWHDLAKLRIADRNTGDTSEVEEKARKEERERLAKISKSGGPNRSAKSTVSASKPNELEELWKSDD